jgi:hypothetical protein
VDSNPNQNFDTPGSGDVIIPRGVEIANWIRNPLDRCSIVMTPRCGLPDGKENRARKTVVETRF